MKHLLLAGAFLLGLLGLAGGANAACNVPNPNLSGPPFVDNCPLPASALNSAFSNLALAGCPLITTYGGKGDGIVDNTSAMNQALAVNPGSACVSFPPGKFKFLSAISRTVTTATENISIVGSGMNNTVLTWPNAVGTAITLTEIGNGNSVHVRDLTMTTGQNKADQGLLVTTTFAPGAQTAVNQAQSDITNVDMHGADGYAATFQWTTAIHLLNVGGFAVNNVNIYGANGGVGGWATSAQGSGVLVEGPGATIAPVVINVSGLNTFMLNAGITIGNNVQGAYIGGGSNFTGVNFGVSVPSAANGYSQLVVADSQFNARTAINVLSSVPGLIVHGNTFIQQVVTSGNPPGGISLFASNNSIITGNLFTGNGSGGVAVSAGANTSGAIGGTITGNTIVANTTGVQLLAGAKLWTVAGNQYFANTTDVVSDVGKNVVDTPLDCTSGVSLAFGGLSTGIAYGVAKGCSYSQVGKEVTVSATFGLTAKGTATGVATIEGLPVTAANLNETGTAEFGSYANLVTAPGLTGTIPQNTNHMLFQVNSATGSTQPNDTNFANSSSWVVKMKYRAP